MVLKSRTTWESPRKLFPPYDEVAAGVARLCVLREDIYLEFAGIAAEEITLTITSTTHPPGIDDNGQAYRRLYFFRASLRTLAEVQETIHGLNSREDFREILDVFDTGALSTVQQYLKKLNKNLNDLRRIRNDLGGHVS